jgi:hypothetical protein
MIRHSTARPTWQLAVQNKARAQCPPRCSTYPRHVSAMGSGFNRRAGAWPHCGMSSRLKTRLGQPLLDRFAQFFVTWLIEATGSPIAPSFYVMFGAAAGCCELNAQAFTGGSPGGL